jgi:histidinol-phosphate aminotransferase
MDTFILPEILALSPYSSARDEFKGAASLLLDANENPFSDEEFGSINRYPDPQHNKVKKLLATYKKIDFSQIILGNGSDEVLDLLLRATTRPHQDSITITPPTYGMYKTLAQLNRLSIYEVPLKHDFSIDPNLILANQSKVLFLCNPNNPTGSLISLETIENIAKNFSGLIVVDEAYIDFCPELSAVPLISTYPNIVVTQTLSKAWGLAGIRVGMLFGTKNLIAGLSSIKMPYNINSLSQKIAEKRLKNQARFFQERDLIISEREKFSSQCALLSIVENVFTSFTNFILVRFKDAPRVFNHLQSQGIIVRDRSKEHGLANCIRVTIGSPTENKILLTALKELS